MQYVLDENGDKVYGSHHIADQLQVEWGQILNFSGGTCFNIDFPSLMNFQKCVTPEDNIILTALPSLEEFKEVVWAMKRWKASGYDGYTVEFFQAS